MSKRIIFVFILIIILTSTIVFSENQVGDIIGDVLHTDIELLVNGQKIESFNINGVTAMYVKDLKNHGFSIHWDGENRSITAKQDSSIQNDLPDFQRTSKQKNVGDVIDHVLYTDIKLLIEGLSIESFNINGSTAMYVRDLNYFDYDVKWNGEERKIYVNYEKMNTNKEEYETGIAKKIFEDGSVYEGSWENYAFDGYGTYTFPNRSRIEGLFSKGRVKNEGGYYNPKGDLVYQGSFNEAFEFDGQGTYYYPDGRYYEGEFKAGEFHGTGQLVIPSVSTTRGLWEAGELVETIKDPLEMSALVEKEKSIAMIHTYNEADEMIGQGSGVVIGSNGLILTNKHVIEGGSYFSVSFTKAEEYLTYDVVRRAPNMDLALLKINTSREKINLGTESEISKGQDVVAIGNPIGLQNTVSKGIISAFRSEDNVDFLQTTAEITNGSSGGALLDLYGNLMGITTSGYGEANLNFAISVASINEFLQDEKTQGEIYIRNNFDSYSYDGKNYDLLYYNSYSNDTLNLNIYAISDSEKTVNIKDSNIVSLLMDLSKHLNREYSVETIEVRIAIEDEIFTMTYSDEKFNLLTWNAAEDTPTTQVSEGTSSVTAQTFADYLMDTYPRLYFSDNSLNINEYAVNIEEDVVYVHAYFDTTQLEEVLQALVDDSDDVHDTFSLIPHEALLAYDKKIYATLIYSDWSETVPNEYFYTNRIYDNTVEYSDEYNEFYIFYPFLEIEYPVEGDTYYYQFD